MTFGLAATEERIEAVGFSSDGSLLAAVTSSDLIVMSHASGDASGARRIALPVEKGDVAQSLAFSPSGTHIAVVYLNAGLMTVALASGDVAKFESPWTHHRVAWSPDERHLAAGQTEPLISIFDVETRQVRCMLDPGVFDDSGRTAVVFAGETLVTTAMNKVCVWPFERVISAKLKLRSEGALERIAILNPKKLGRDGFRHLMGLALAPDQRQVALLEDAESEHAVSRIDLSSGKSIGRALPLDLAMTGIVWTGEPNVVAISSDERGITLFDLERRRELERVFDEIGAAEVLGLASDPRQMLLVAGTSRGLRLWDLHRAS